MLRRVPGRRIPQCSIQTDGGIGFGVRLSSGQEPSRRLGVIGSTCLFRSWDSEERWISALQPAGGYLARRHWTGAQSERKRR